MLIICWKLYSKSSMIDLATLRLSFGMVGAYLPVKCVLVADSDRNETSNSANRREKLGKLVSSASAFNALYALEQT